MAMPISQTSTHSRVRRRAGLIYLAVAAVPVALGAPYATAAGTSSRALNASGELKRTAKPGAHSTVQEGTLRGKPFGAGKMVLRSSLSRAIVTSTFTLQTSAGLVRGRARARLTLDGDTAHYKGTATITSGTRRYRDARGSNITFTGVGPVSAKSTKITLRGYVRY
jgi:hypothetical protein